MKRIQIIFFGLCLTTMLSAQSSHPAKWTYQYQKIAENTYDLILKVTIDSTYKVYTSVANEDGPIPFNAWSEGIQNLNITQEMKEVTTPICVYHSIFQMDVCYVENIATFKQQVTITNPTKPASINIFYEFMAENSERTFPPDIHCLKFNFAPNKPMKIKEISKESITKCEE